MFLALTLPLVGLLISIPGIPGLGRPKLPHLRMPHKAVVDTIPPVWKPYSLLAVEDAYVFAALPALGPKTASFKITNDPRQLDVSVDTDSGTVSAVPELGEVPLGDAARVPFADYNRDLTWQNFRKVWTEKSRASVNAPAGQSVASASGAGNGFSFALPSPLPKRVQSLLGPGGPSINVSGSESIRLAGTSQWTNQETGLLGARRSLFPALDMQQDLNIHLEGQLSDRVKIGLLQNSATQIPLTNKIAINYRGEEDDLVQEFDLGNTNLSLPGTQYVSYSGRNEGLFGMKAATRFGPLDFTVLASKQEGKSERASYTGGSSRQTQTLNDYDYVRGVYFFLYDPNLETQEIDESSIRIYLDDGNNYANRVNAVRGRAFVDPRGAVLDSFPADPTPSVRGVFTLLAAGAENDYEILNDVYGPRYKVIRLKRAITGEQQRLAVTYAYRPVVGGQATGSLLTMGGTDTLDTDGETARTMKLLRAPLNKLPADENGNFDTTTPFAPTRELELRNFYQLAGQRIDPKSFTLTIRQGVTSPPVTFETVGNEAVPYTEILGLDTFDESQGTPVYRKHDGKVDGTLATSNSRLFVDYENGTVFFFDLRPFAPRIANDAAYPARPFEQALSNVLFRRDSLVGPDNAPNARNRGIYDLRNPVRSTASQYYIDLDFTAARAGNEITLGRTNIIEGSETVTKNGVKLERDRDYTIDYDLGRVTLKAAPGAADQINVDYGFAPLFQQAGRTLIGSAFRLAGKDKGIGGAFMYESKGAQDLRPRLGEEPSRLLIGDLNGQWTTRPAFLTRWIDALPGVRTTAPSDFNVAAEMGASIPNPNTFNEVFIDDMEGVRDAVSLSMTPERWHWSSMPSRKDAITGIADSIQTFERDAEVHWFTPLNAVKERELKPNLTDAQGAQNPHQSLAISVPRRPSTATASDALWVGLTYALDPVGIDLSRAQFIEVWVNDFRDGQKVPHTPGSSVRLHVDLGVVSEDERRSPVIAANRLLDSEDLPPRDNQLTVTDNNNEDTGLDGIAGAGEPPDPSLVTADAVADPAGDNFKSPVVDNNDPRHNLDPDRWLYINGTEGNKNAVPIPDTEDLNLNNSLDTQEDYFEYTVDLGGGSSYLADSVYAPGRVFANNGDPVPADNGWRRYRIPITDTLRTKFGSPDLTLARHVRIWIDGITVTDDQVNPSIGEKRPQVMLGGVEIVGSRWLVSDLTPAQVDSGTTVTLNAVNNVDNADVYTAPFDPGSQRNGSLDQTRREQSLALEFTRLLPGDTLETYKTFSLDEDYSRYGTLRFYVAGFDIPGYIPSSGNLVYAVRFASDERGQNYYEYRAPVPSSSTPGAIGWSDVHLKLTDLSNLKLDPQYAGRDTIIAPGAEPGVTLIVKGRPSFTRLRRISLAVLNLDPTTVYPSGRVWFDELRATDVARDRGTAQRVSITGTMANLFRYGFSYDARDEDFMSVGESRGSGSRSSAYTATAGIDLHRFIEGSGIVLPVTLNLSQNTSQPRYTAGDDVVRTGALAQASESGNGSRSYSVSYARNWSERSNPFLRYTLGGITGSLGQSRSDYHNPAAVDTTVSLNAAVGYSIAPRKLLGVPLPGTKVRLWPLPERFYWNYAIATRRSHTYDRLRDGSGALVLRNATQGRSAGIDFGADTRPFDFLHHQFQAHRNLTLPDPLREQWGFINFGRVVQWNQSMDSRYVMHIGQWLRPQLGWNASYFQNNGPELSSDLSVRAVNNSESATMVWGLPFDMMIRPPSGARDSTRKGPPVLKTLLSKLGPVTLDAGAGHGSSYSRLIGTPSFAYLTGLSIDPGLNPDSTGSVQAVFGNSISENQDFHGGARTRVALAYGAGIQTHGEFQFHKSATNNLVNRTHRVQWPDLDMDFGKLPEVIGLKKLFTNPKIRSTFVRSRTTEFSNSDTPTNISTSQEWRPLIGFTGSLRNGTRAEFRIQHRSTSAEYLQVGSSITTDANTDIDLNLSREYTKGQKVTVLGKESTLKTNITLGLTGAYSRRKSETRQAGVDRPFNPINEDRLNINGRASYGFSNNVTGNAEVGFGQNRDLQRDIITRSIRLELRAQFTF